MNIVCYFIVTFLFVVTPSLAHSYIVGTELPPVYQFKGDMPPMRLTFTDLERFLRRLEQFTRDKQTICTYELVGSQRKVTSSSIGNLFQNDRPLSYATEFGLRCQDGRQFSPSISLSLRQFATWEIEGTDQIYLENLRRLIEDFGEEYRAYLAGPLLQMATLMAPFAFFWFIVPTVSTRVFGLRGDTQSQVGIASYVFGTGMFFWFLVNQTPLGWFPTVAIHKVTANILERYNAEISFWGLIISLGFAIWAYWYPKAPRASGETTLPEDPPKTERL